MTDINNILHKAYLEGVEDRKQNPSWNDQGVDSFFIYEAFREGQFDRKMFPCDVATILAEQAEYGKIDRENVSFLLR